MTELEKIVYKITNIARIHRLTLESCNVPTLREFATGIVPDAHKLTKNELIDNLLEVSQNWVFTEAYIVELEEQSKEGTEGLFEGVWSLICSRGDSISTNLKKGRTDLKKALYSYARDAKWAKGFYADFLDYTNKYLELALIDDTEATQSELNTLLSWAEGVLRSENPRWQELSLALSITSGMTMDHLHGEGFKPPSEKSLLVDQDLWIDAFDTKMPQKRKKVPQNIIRGTFNGNIGRALRAKVYPRLGFTTYRDAKRAYESISRAIKINRGGVVHE